jgi:hypothetical protein
MVNSGEYGGKVIRGFKGDGLGFIAGAILKPEDVIHWPLSNRIALHANGNVEWYGPPVEAEQVAREAGKPAKARGKVAPKAEPAEKAPTAPAGRRVRNK